MAIERPIYSTQSDEPTKPLTLGKIGCVTLMTGGIFGGGSALIFGPQVGLEVAIGMSGLMGGVIQGISSDERAVEFAKEGRKKRAFVEALKGTFETAFGLALAGATVGHGISGGHIEGAIIGGAVLALVSLGFGQFAFRHVSEALSVKDNLHLKP